MKEKIQAFMAKRQAKGKRSYEIDMCNGPLLGKILRFAVPLMLSGVLQLFFNAADIVVVGRFTGHTALAAVGSTKGQMVAIDLTARTDLRNADEFRKLIVTDIQRYGKIIQETGANKQK